MHAYTSIFERADQGAQRSQYTVRPIEVRDLTGIVVLCAEHAAFEEVTYSPIGKEDRLRDYFFGDPPRAYCLVVERNNALVGYATFAPEFSTWDASEYMHMDCIYLRPDARNQGVGAKVVATISAIAMDLGCVGLQWQTPSWNTNAISFYRRLGSTFRGKVRFFMDLPTMERLAANIASADALQRL